jgi:hypothetical protein
MADIEVGKIAGNLTVYLVKGDIATIVFRYSVNGAEASWPEAPVLTLGTVNIPMTLSEDGVVAAVTVDAATVDSIIASGNKNNELNVGQILTWRGKYVVS